MYHCKNHGEIDAIGLPPRCPKCGKKAKDTAPLTPPDIVYLGSVEISRRSLVQLQREGYIGNLKDEEVSY